MPVGVLPHYRPCLLAWCLTIVHGLLVSCHCNSHFSSRVQMQEGWLQVWCYFYRGAITSDMSADPVPLSDMPACTMQLCQTCMMGLFIQIRVFVKCFSFSQGICSVTNPSDMPTDKVPLPQVCNTCQLPSWTPS